MKLGSFVLFSLFLLVIATAAYSQAVPTKLAFIDSAAFGDEKAGVTKYVNAYRSLAAEFKPATDELATIDKRLETLGKEAQAIQDKINSAESIVDIKPLRASLEEKEDEAQRLKIDFQRKQEDLKARYAKREATVAVPIMNEIGNAIEMYRKAKGYDLILDAAKLAETILSYDKSLDITAAFIADFNSKTSGLPAK